FHFAFCILRFAFSTFPARRNKKYFIFRANELKLVVLRHSGGTAYEAGRVYRCFNLTYNEIWRKTVRN
ncbi:MAG TPA: hypothetical protein VK400_16490, partial [Pyrinomonadaceae bacterium]|nr:hypothetical protein [Pyrinomonadaceae bacterium]